MMAGADNKLNSMDSVLVDIENVVIIYGMWWALQPIDVAYMKLGENCQRLNVLGNQSSHLAQPVLD